MLRFCFGCKKDYPESMMKKGSGNQFYCPPCLVRRQQNLKMAKVRAKAIATGSPLPLEG